LQILRGKVNMNTLRILSIFLIFISIIFIFIGIINKYIEVGLFLIFPFMVGSGIYAALSFIIMFIGLFLFFLSFIYDFENVERIEIKNYENVDIDKNKKTEYGGIILIGPIPIIFGNSEMNVKILIILTIVLMIIMTILMLLFLH